MVPSIPSCHMPYDKVSSYKAAQRRKTAHPWWCLRPARSWSETVHRKPTAKDAATVQSLSHTDKSAPGQKRRPSTASARWNEPPSPPNKTLSFRPAEKRLPEIRYAAAGDGCCNLRQSPDRVVPPHHRQTRKDNKPETPAASIEKSPFHKTARSARVDIFCRIFSPVRRQVSYLSK